MNHVEGALLRLEEKTTASDKLNAEITLNAEMQQQINMLASSFGEVSTHATHRSSSINSDMGGIHFRLMKLDFPPMTVKKIPRNGFFG